MTSRSYDDDCHLLGNSLNDCLLLEVGPDFTEKMERVHLLAQASCGPGSSDTSRMASLRKTDETRRRDTMSADRAELDGQADI
ncbi:hypothetical protein R1flu_007921 [Riccia fluitans]|uniref:Uncharacterized protein n=1 Tax=Riccia fluitans TaxID=41844 RepID=A0ABD1Z4D4_9MARC